MPMGIIMVWLRVNFDAVDHNRDCKCDDGVGCGDVNGTVSARTVMVGISSGDVNRDGDVNARTVTVGICSGDVNRDGDDNGVTIL